MFVYYIILCYTGVEGGGQSPRREGAGEGRWAGYPARGGGREARGNRKSSCLHFSICACHPCAGGHANLLPTVPMLADGPRRESRGREGVARRRQAQNARRARRPPRLAPHAWRAEGARHRRSRPSRGRYVHIIALLVCLFMSFFVDALSLTLILLFSAGPASSQPST